MGSWGATIIVEPRFLVREALASLMGNLSYSVVCSVGTAADISSSTIGDGRKLVILGALSAEDAASEATIIRKLWPDSKIMVLLESASSLDLQKLLTSQIDGCVPLYVSADTLSSTLELIIVQDLRVMVVGGANVHLMQRTRSEEEHDPENAVEKSPSSTVCQATTSLAMAGLQRTAAQGTGGAPPNTGAGNSIVDGTSSLRTPTLSERETQVLDGLVKGHANKVIARTCDISEATVKVHMKSILRKIRVANRTQAAIWALERGYCADEFRDRALKAAPTAREGTVVI